MECVSATNTLLISIGGLPAPIQIHAKRRRYEYLLPAWLLDETADGPWPGPPKGQENLIPLLRRLRWMGLLPFGHCNGDHDGTRRRCPLWHNFSASALPHSPSSQRRLFRFFAMEVVQSSPGGGADATDYVVLSINADAFMSQQVSWLEDDKTHRAALLGR